MSAKQPDLVLTRLVDAARERQPSRLGAAGLGLELHR